MKKIWKRVCTGLLTLTTILTALPTTSVQAAETQYWTESSERVGYIEHVMNDGTIHSTFNEGHMRVEGDVDAILMGRRTQYPAEAIQLVERLAQEFVNDLFSTLRERMLDLRYCKVVFVGGGAILLRRQIEDSGKVGTPLFVTNINANAAGFEYLYRLETVGR